MEKTDEVKRNVTHEEVLRERCDDLLVKMRPRTRQAVLTLLETAYAQIDGAKCILERDEGVDSLGEYYDLREVLAAAREGVDAVVDRIAKADARAVMGFRADDVFDPATNMHVIGKSPLFAEQVLVNEERAVSGPQGLAYEAQLIDGVVGDLAPLKGAPGTDQILVRLTCIAERLRFREEKIRVLDLKNEAAAIESIAGVESYVSDEAALKLRNVAARLRGKP